MSELPLLTSYISLRRDKAPEFRQVIAPIISKFRLVLPQNRQHLTPSHPFLTPTHFKKLSLFNSSLLTSTRTYVKLEYMRLKGSLTGQYRSTSSPCMRSV